VLRSASAHVSVDKAIDLLAMPSDVVASDRWGEMDYRSLAAKLAQHRHRRPVIVATAGTTMTEAVDDVHRIVAVCDEVGVHDRFIYVDAALSGLPLAVVLDEGRIVECGTVRRPRCG